MLSSTEVPGHSLSAVVGGTVAGVAAAAVAALVLVIVVRRKHRLDKGEILQTAIYKTLVNKQVIAVKGI